MRGSPLPAPANSRAKRGEQGEVMSEDRAICMDERGAPLRACPTTVIAITNTITPKSAVFRVFES